MLPSKNKTKLKRNKQRLKLRIKTLTWFQTKNNQDTHLILNKNKQTSFYSHKEKALKTITSKTINSTSLITSRWEKEMDNICLLIEKRKW